MSRFVDGFLCPETAGFSRAGSYKIRRLPLVRWLTGMLQRADKRALKWDVVKLALELEFPPEEAEKQLDTLIHWGRYAEILAYDDGSEEISLENGVEKTG